MRPALSVAIAQPCHQRWADMTPAGPGRHCAACQKTVVDFTHQTDVEILATLRRAAGETCGRLRADQLGRPLVAPTPAPRWRAWLGAVLALGGALGASRAAAQGQPDSYYAGPRPPSPTSSVGAASGASHAAMLATPALAPDAPFTVRGVVQDAATHEGIPGVTVILKGTTIGASSDADGAFQVVVPAGVSAPLLLFSSVGYSSEERAPTPGQSLTVALAADAHMLGEMGIVVTGGPAQRPWPWHPRRFFNWSKYWLAKPFRG